MILNMKSKKHIVIKLTEKQLREASKDAFEYLTNLDTVPNNGQTEISVNGKLNDKEDGIPMTTDRFASMNTPQGYNRYGGTGNSYTTMGVRESNDDNKDGVDDFYNNSEMDLLGNGDDDDNLTGISNTIDMKTDAFVNLIKNLPAKKQAIVLNKIIESMNLTDISYRWKKEIIKKINASSNDRINQ